MFFRVCVEEGSVGEQGREVSAWWWFVWRGVWKEGGDGGGSVSVGEVVCVWCVCVVCVVCVVPMINVTACLSRRVRAMQLIRVAEHLGASSRRPRHPFPALMAEGPWPCTCVHGQKSHPVRP